MASRELVKLYFDYKSPFAYLAMAPAFALPARFEIELRWIPYLLRIKGKGESSVYSEWKVRYSYLDARRIANARGGFTIRGPRKVYDSTPALIGALFAQGGGFFPAYTEAVFSALLRAPARDRRSGSGRQADRRARRLGSRLPRLPGGGRRPRVRGLPRRGRAGPHLRRADLHVSRRAVLGPGPHPAARAAAARGRAGA